MRASARYFKSPDDRSHANSIPPAPTLRSKAVMITSRETLGIGGCGAVNYIGARLAVNGNVDLTLPVDVDDAGLDLVRILSAAPPVPSRTPSFHRAGHCAR